MNVTVYADVLFLINFIINIILLKISSMFMKNPMSPMRLSAAGGLGAIYAVCMFFPDISFLYIFPFRLLVSVIMLIIVCPKAGYIRLIKLTAVFYMVSFTFAGVLLALIYIGSISSAVSPVMHNGIFYFDISLTSLLAASAVSYVVISISSAIFRRNKTMGIKILRIVLSDRICEISALSDSGNLLEDPISKVPVVIAEKSYLEGLFPEGVPDMECIDDAGLKIRLIPYSSLGNTGGMMAGFIPDEVMIDGHKINDVIIAISPCALSGTNDYNALFNPNILSGGKRKCI